MPAGGPRRGLRLDGADLGRPPRGAGGPAADRAHQLVNAVALGRVGNREVIVSGSHDETVRIWDSHGTAAATVDVLAKVETVDLSQDGVLYAGTGHALCAFTTSTPTF